MIVDSIYKNYYFLLSSILILTVLIFLPTFNNDFQMEWDDQWMLHNPFTPEGLKWGIIKLYFAKGFTGQYSPINQLMYSLLYAIDGYNPFVYHTASLFIHLINIICVFALTNIILSDCLTKEKQLSIKFIIFVSTLIFAIHPLQVESVAWISASKILLSSTFYLLAGISFVSFIKKRHFFLYAITFVLFVLSYLTKEQTVTFPLFATLICYWYKIKPNKIKFWKYVCPLYGLAILCGLHFLYSVSSYEQFADTSVYVWWQRLIYCFYSIVSYFFKWLFPSNLDWMYEFPAPYGESMPVWLILYPILFCTFLLCFWDKVKNRLIVSSLLITFINLLLVLHLFILPRGAVIADRYMYLPIIGINIIFAYYMGIIRKRHKRFSYSILFCIGLLFSFLTFYRTQDWKNSTTLKKEEPNEKWISNK